MDDTVETHEGDIYNRDAVLTRIDTLFSKPQEEQSEKTEKFIQECLKILTESSTPQEFGIFSRSRKGFLHPDSAIRRNYLVDPFHIDDPDVYRTLMDTIGVFKADSRWQDRSLREIVPYAVQRAIGIYFGNEYGVNNTEEENQAFYLERSSSNSEDIHLAELKGKGFAVCAEKAAVAQNLLSFLGYTTELVATSTFYTENHQSENAHMYSIISNGQNHFIFDPTNPSLIKDGDEKVVMVFPSNSLIKDSAYKELMSGGKASVIHNDGTWDGKNVIKGPDETWVYGGPSKAAVM